MIKHVQMLTKSKSGKVLFRYVLAFLIPTATEWVVGMRINHCHLKISQPPFYIQGSRRVSPSEMFSIHDNSIRYYNEDQLGDDEWLWTQTIGSEDEDVET